MLIHVDTCLLACIVCFGSTRDTVLRIYHITPPPPHHHTNTHICKHTPLLVVRQTPGRVLCLSWFDLDGSPCFPDPAFTGCFVVGQCLFHLRAPPLALSFFNRWQDHRGPGSWQPACAVRNSQRPWTPTGPAGSQKWRPSPLQMPAPTPGIPTWRTLLLWRATTQDVCRQMAMSLKVAIASLSFLSRFTHQSPPRQGLSLTGQFAKRPLSRDNITSFTYGKGDARAQPGVRGEKKPHERDNIRLITLVTLHDTIRFF
jgi:hypothetical protein